MSRLREERVPVVDREDDTQMAQRLQRLRKERREQLEAWQRAKQLEASPLPPVEPEPVEPEPVGPEPVVTMARFLRMCLGRAKNALKGPVRKVEELREAIKLSESREDRPWERLKQGVPLGRSELAHPSSN